MEPTPRAITARRRPSRVVAWLLLFLLVVPALLVPAPAAARDVEDLQGEWVSLTDRIPEVQFTGWAGIGYDSLPIRDFAFRADRQIRLGGTTYPKGMGVYPYSELRYRLDRGYLALSGVVGPDGFAVPPAARVRFRVVGDGQMLWDSGPLGAGELKRIDALSLRGVDDLRLLTIDDTDGRARSPAAWADMRLLPARTVTRRTDASVDAERRAAVEQSAGLAEWRQRSAAEARLIADQVKPGAVGAVFGDQGRSILLASDSLTAKLELAGETAGELLLLDRRRDALVFDGARTQVWLEGREGPVLRAGVDLKYDRAFSSQYDDPALGPMTVAQVGFRSDDFRYYLWLELGLFSQQATLWQRATLFDELGQGTPITVDPFGPTASVFFGDQSKLLLDDGRLRQRDVEPNGLAVAEPLGLGKPAILWDSRQGSGLALVAVDETPGQPRLRTQLLPGSVAGSLQFEYDTRAASRTDLIAGPRIILHVGADASQAATLVPLRNLLARLYPQRLPPDWARFQWISWYAWYMDVTDEKLRKEVDVIRRRFADLGPWYVVIDAGWYVAEGRPGADWRNVDREKFPLGLRSLVDYAHARDVGVVLYFSTPHVDTRQYPGDWLGLPGTVDQLGSDLIHLGRKDGHDSYAFDYDNPAVRRYLDQVFEGFFVDYGVDGLQLDGLGNVESAGVRPRLMDGFGLVDAVTAETMNIYRFHADQLQRLRPDALIQTGWDAPIFANGLANSFWYGDDTMAFRHPYPHPGLYEKIQYALFQALVLGQRPQFGSIYRRPVRPGINDQWLAAAVTIGAPMGLSFELDQLPADAAARYRLLLNRYDPWGNGVTADRIDHPTCFARQVDDVWAISVVNLEEQPIDRQVRLAECGLALTGDASGIDLISWQPVAVRGGVLTLRLEPESVHTVLVRTTTGMLTSSSRFERSGDGWTVSGPTDVPGISYLVVPRPPQHLTLDGEPLAPEGVEYDPATFVATIRYAHTGEPQRLTGG